jgi:general stress protein 26
MKPKSQRFIHFNFVLVILLITPSLMAQELLVKDRPEIPRDSLLKVALTIIESAQSKALITVDEDGKPQARTMSVFPIEEDWVIWLGTSTNSRKIKQIKNNPNVMVFYYDSNGKSYVSVAGQARIVDDPEKKAHYWMDGWTVFYPNPEKDYILIEVTPERLEVCSFQYELFWNAAGRPAFVEF